MESIKLLYAISDEIKKLEEAYNRLVHHQNCLQFWSLLMCIAFFEKVHFTEIHNRILADGLSDKLLSNLNLENENKIFRLSVQGGVMTKDFVPIESYADLVECLKKQKI